MSVSIDVLAFEVEDNTVTLRNEEWVTLLTVAELYVGEVALQPAPDVVRHVTRRLMRQLIPSTDM